MYCLLVGNKGISCAYNPHVIYSFYPTTLTPQGSGISEEYLQMLFATAMEGLKSATLSFLEFSRFRLGFRVWGLGLPQRSK